MAIFEMNKYLPKEEGNTEDNIESKGKEVKEVKIAKLGERSASEVIAKALIEALRKEDIELIEKPKDSGNGVFSNIKIVSTEDINNDFRGAVNFIDDNDIIVTDMSLPNTTNERMFDDLINEKGNVVYRDLGKAASELYDRVEGVIPEVHDDTTQDLSNEDIKLQDLFPGDKVPVDGIMHEVVFRDSYIIVFREETQHPCTKENYLVVDCPKGV